MLIGTAKNVILKTQCRGHMVAPGVYTLGPEVSEGNSICGLSSLLSIHLSLIKEKKKEKKIHNGELKPRGRVS